MSHSSQHMPDARIDVEAYVKMCVLKWQMLIFTYIYIYIQKYIYTNIYIYTYKQIYIYIYTYIQNKLASVRLIRMHMRCQQRWATA